MFEEIYRKLNAIKEGVYDLKEIDTWEGGFLWGIWEEYKYHNKSSWRASEITETLHALLNYIEEEYNELKELKNLEIHHVDCEVTDDSIVFEIEYYDPGCYTPSKIEIEKSVWIRRR
ncbi:hypothetical protein [Thermotoga sp.]|uniref:hypothetical protein n=1 Tax=Thermotoga sp. TaxID=28240 RepID=UPI0025CEBEAE|nr:hypothetical protein [Thermotoga sp.]MCD6551730.1 hypothetical protein [Thermotoga sp.]